MSEAVTQAVGWGVFRHDLAAPLTGYADVMPVDASGSPLERHVPGADCPCSPQVRPASLVHGGVISHREPGHPGSEFDFD